MEARKVHYQSADKSLVPSKFLRSNIIREYHLNSGRTDHELNHVVKKNIPSASTSNNNHLVTYQHLGKASWFDFVLPVTILGIVVLGVVVVSVILFIWFKNYLQEKREQKRGSTSASDRYYKDQLQLMHKKMEKIKLKEMNHKLKQKIGVERQVLDDETQIETIEYKIKNSPPNTPNAQKQVDSESSDEELEANTSGNHLPDSIRNPSPIIIPVPMIVPLPVAHFYTTDSSSSLSLVQPNLNEEQQHQLATNSTISHLQEKVHCIQPQNIEMSNKFYKSIATSPPPFSPLAQPLKYATIGTQTIFTKAPNSPGIGSPFGIMPNSKPSSPPILATDNKENRVATGRRAVCLNKAISSFKSDNSDNYDTHPASPVLASPCVVQLSPKLNYNVLQQQNSPVILESPPAARFNFSPKLMTTNSPASANYKYGNYFRFPEVDMFTPPAAVKKEDVRDVRDIKEDIIEIEEESDVTESQDTSEIIEEREGSERRMDEVTDAEHSALILKMQAMSIDSDKDGTAEEFPKDTFILKIDEIEEQSPITPVTACRDLNIRNNNSENTLNIRRARLKSISLDSEGARLVEENLGIPLEELLEQTHTDHSEHNEQNEQMLDNLSDEMDEPIGDVAKPKNIYNLTLDLEFQDNSLIGNDNVSEMSEVSEVPEEMDEDKFNRTPTMKYFRHKAVSLDSDNQETSITKSNYTSTSTTVSKQMDTLNYYFATNTKLNSSISVPSTPKHLCSGKLKLSTSDQEPSNTKYGQRTFHLARKLGSFDEKSSDQNIELTLPGTSSYKSSLTTGMPNLNVSTGNLKTLPEIPSIHDFDHHKKIHVAPPSSFPKSTLLQRRASNHSLTLNLDGSVGNLSRGLSCSNYSLANLQGSHLNITGSNCNLNGSAAAQQHARMNAVSVNRESSSKRNLLQRRGSNTSLTLNVQGSNQSLNRFNSHSSLNITANLQQQQKKGLLERRNSNASLTLNVRGGLSLSNCNLRGSECSLSSVNTNQMNDLMMENEAEYAQEQEDMLVSQCQQSKRHRKFLSTENLHHVKPIAAPGRKSPGRANAYGSIDNLKVDVSGHDQAMLKNITTQPLSPQSTTEDFKSYLASIQLLQNATNVLSEHHLKTLHSLFQRSYNNQPREPKLEATTYCHFNNDDELNSKQDDIVEAVIDMDTPRTSPDEEQKKMLTQLHQEFWDLPTNYQEKPLVFGSQAKNRYKTILPNDHSRVKLMPELGNTQEPYINANYIKGADYTTDTYIATQGPMANTIYEFWLMVMQNTLKADGGRQKIGMLTDIVEAGRQKCAVYMPVEPTDAPLVFTSTNNAQEDVDLVERNLSSIMENCEEPFDSATEPEDNNLNFNYFVVQCQEVCKKNGYSIRKLKYFYGRKLDRCWRSCYVYHYWFPDWPDHRSPRDIHVLLDFSLDLLDGDCALDFSGESEVETQSRTLPIIHCSAGIGRTGCLVAILNGLSQMRATTLNSDNSYGQLAVDVLGIVCNLRLQRGGMVQNSEQYELIHRVLSLATTKLNSQI